MCEKRKLTDKKKLKYQYTRTRNCNYLQQIYP